MRKPLIAYIAGLSAPKGRRMGHAGAIISAFGESAQEKVEILKEAGVVIVPTPASFGEVVADTLALTKKAA
jgi:malate-CoA ligase subunit alpha